LAIDKDDDLDAAADNAEFVQAPVTAELACLIAEDDNIPDNVTPLIRPALNAKIIPYSTAKCGLMVWTCGKDDEEMISLEVVLRRFSEVAPPPREKGVRLLVFFVFAFLPVVILLVLVAA
jgi:hypothetical protein